MPFKQIIFDVQYAEDNCKAFTFYLRIDLLMKVKRV